MQLLPFFLEFALETRNVYKFASFDKKVPLILSHIHHLFGAFMIGDLFFLRRLHDGGQLKVGGANVE